MICDKGKVYLLYKKLLFMIVILGQ